VTVLALAVIAGALVLKFRGAPPPPVALIDAEPGRVEVPAPPPPSGVELTLRAEPREAAWRIGDGRECNPCTVTREAGTKLAARVSAEGYADSDVTLEFDVPRVVTVVLQRAPETSKRPPVAPPPKTRKQKTSLEIDETNPYR
jgi:hypothetical protein